MLLKVPDSIKRFIEKYAGNPGNEKSKLLPIYMAGILFTPGKRTMTALGDTILTDRRHKTSVCKFFRRKTFRSQDLTMQVIRRLISEVLKIYGMAGEWILMIDGTSARRGAFSKIANAVQFRLEDHVWSHRSK